MGRFLSFTTVIIAGIITTTSASAATLSGVGDYVGNAGIGIANGDVPASGPSTDSYVFVSTDGGVTGPGLGLSGDKKGSALTTFAFDVLAGDMLSYYFNFVTSDGAGFSDYAYVTLNDAGSGDLTATLFTARTKASGDIAPGFGLPAISPGVTLVPTASPIIPGAPEWTALGGDSGECYRAGCGTTGWIQSLYTFASAGSFTFTFGVVNWGDNDYDTGLAIAGLIAGDTVVIPGGEDIPVISAVPLPAGGLLLLSAFAGLGALRRARKS